MMANITLTTRSNAANRTYSAHFEGIEVGARKKTKTIQVMGMYISRVCFLETSRSKVLEVKLLGETGSYYHRYRVASFP